MDETGYRQRFLGDFQDSPLSMIERVAKALYESDRGGDWEGLRKFSNGHSMWLRFAEVAITAIRVPTEAMSAKGCACSTNRSAHCFRAMIDAALNPHPPTSKKTPPSSPKAE